MGGLLGSIIGAIGQGALWGVMVLGVYITFRVLDVADLTVDGSFATGGCVFAALVSKQVNVSLALVLAFCTGLLCGFITGSLHAKFKIPAILAGILTQLGLYSINLRILSDKANLGINNVPTHIVKVAKGLHLTQSQGGLIVGLIFSVVIVLLMYYFFGTDLGRAIRATGNNEDMIRALGVDTDKMKILGLSLSNGLIALSGALVVEMNKYADVSMGKGAIVYGLAAIVIGEVVFRFFKNFGFKLFATVLGCMIFFIIRAIVIRIGLKANDMQLISSIIVALALIIPNLKNKAKEKK